MVEVRAKAPPSAEATSDAQIGKTMPACMPNLFPQLCRVKMDFTPVRALCSIRAAAAMELIAPMVYHDAPDLASRTSAPRRILARPARIGAIRPAMLNTRTVGDLMMFGREDIKIEH